MLFPPFQGGFSGDYHLVLLFPFYPEGQVAAPHFLIKEGWTLLLQDPSSAALGLQGIFLHNVPSSSAALGWSVSCQTLNHEMFAMQIKKDLFKTAEIFQNAGCSLQASWNHRRDYKAVLSDFFGK